MQQTIGILIIIITIYCIKKFKDKKENIDYKKIYIKKDYILTNNELKFYKILQEITNQFELTIFTQVALNQIIKAKNKKSFYKICNKSIDYVITNNIGMIKICIELDDITHNRPDRIERDKFINELFKSVEIPLLRIPVKNSYNVNSIETKIKELISL